MLTQEQVSQALVKWMEDFVERPHPGLGNWPPCPYARQARMSNNILIKPGTIPVADGISLTEYDWAKEVVVFWYQAIDPDEFVQQVNQANIALKNFDIVGLEDHPDTEEIVSTVKMNFGLCPIVVYQKLSKLNQAADQLREKGYYDTWSQSDLDNIVNWRYK